MYKATSLNVYLGITFIIIKISLLQSQKISYTYLLNK